MTRYAIVGLIALFTIAGRIWFYSNAGQTYLIKSELQDYGARLNDDETLAAIARSLNQAGESQLALQVADRITDIAAKNAALKEITRFHSTYGDKEKASSLLSVAIKTAERIDEDSYKADALSAIVVSYARLGARTK